MKTTELYTDAGIARIYPRCNEWGWTLNGSEGLERTFGDAIEAAEEESIRQKNSEPTYHLNDDNTITFYFPHGCKQDHDLFIREIETMLGLTHVHSESDFDGKATTVHRWS